MPQLNERGLSCNIIVCQYCFEFKHGVAEQGCLSACIDISAAKWQEYAVLIWTWQLLEIAAATILAICKKNEISLYDYHNIFASCL
jgi:hypothetical protein